MNNNEELRKLAQYAASTFRTGCSDLSQQAAGLADDIAEIQTLAEESKSLEVGKASLTKVDEN